LLAVDLYVFRINHLYLAFCAVPEPMQPRQRRGGG
jgi:hypothetical protein